MERENRFTGAMNRLKERAGNAVVGLRTAIVGRITGDSTTNPQEVPPYLNYKKYSNSQLSPAGQESRRLHEAGIRDALSGNKWRDSRSES